jgi:hypothetical protein
MPDYAVIADVSRTLESVLTSSRALSGVSSVLDDAEGSLLAGMTNMLFQIVSSVLAQSPESVLVGHVDSEEEVGAHVRLTRADVVMMQSKCPGDGETAWPLLYQFPELKVVTIASSGRNGFVHEVRPVVPPLLDLSTETLYAALRSDSPRRPN